MKFGNLIANLYDISTMIIWFDSLASRNMTYLTFTVLNQQGERSKIVLSRVCMFNRAFI